MQTKKNKNRIKFKEDKNDESKILIAIIHADWCPHCTQIMQPVDGEENSIWSSVKSACEPEITVLAFESNDIERQPFMDSNEITLSGYPTIVKIVKNKPVEYYNGERTKDELIAWAKRHDSIDGGNGTLLGGNGTLLGGNGTLLGGNSRRNRNKKTKKIAFNKSKKNRKTRTK
jgi:hypothetical protein